MVVIGSGAGDAALALEAAGGVVIAVETPSFSPGLWARELLPLLADVDVVIVPGSPDGRDLAPRVAQAINGTLRSNVVRVQPDDVTIALWGGRVQHVHRIEGPSVLVLQPGAFGSRSSTATVEQRNLPLDTTVDGVELLEVVAADAASIDLGEAARIFGAGVGVGSEDNLRVMAAVAGHLGASVGGTRVVTDLGWLPFERQIGTTGVTVDPDLYVAFGVSGAVQHVSGLGRPHHVVSVNTDSSCPMMSMADLAVVADAPAVLDELLRLVCVSTGASEEQK